MGPVSLNGSVSLYDPVGLNGSSQSGWVQSVWMGLVSPDRFSRSEWVQSVHIGPVSLDRFSRSERVQSVHMSPVSLDGSSQSGWVH